MNRKSPRKDELSIITVAYCFPIRAIDWMKPYKEKYERFLHTGNSATDAGNAILLHSEGDGSQFPSLFAVDNAEEIAAKEAEKEELKEAANSASSRASSSSSNAGYSTRASTYCTTDGDKFVHCSSRSAVWPIYNGNV